MAKTKFFKGQSVIGKSTDRNARGKITDIIPSKTSDETRYVVNDGVYNTTFNESELTEFIRKPFAPTDEEMAKIKGEFPFLKRGKVELIYERNSMFVFKFNHSNQVGYGMFLKDEYRSLSEKDYHKWETYLG